MKITLFAVVVGVAACGGKTNHSVCDQQNPDPACTQQCNATPGAPDTCPQGFHCTPDGTCDAECTPTGGECGAGYTCTGDGTCEGTGSGSNGPDASCPAINFTPMPTTPSIGLVLDQSGSMFTNDLSPNVTRYAAMRDALVGPQGVVTTLESKAYFGSELFTCANSAVALTTKGRKLDNAAAIRSSIDSKTSGSNTPTPEAINAEVASFAANPPPAGSPPIIVLATDGLPNTCPDNTVDTSAQSVAAAAAAYAAGLPVYVLAINSNSQHFQDLANAGQGHQPNQPNVPYYPVASVQQLKDAFNAIIGGVISCDLTLTSGIDATAAMSGTVIVDGVTLTYGTDWKLVNGNVIRLLGAACTSLKSTPNPTVTASFPCGSVIF